MNAYWLASQIAKCVAHAMLTSTLPSAADK